MRCVGSGISLCGHMLIVALLALACTQAHAAGNYPYTGEVTGYDTNVRAGSNLNYEIVTKLQKGDLVYVAGEWMEWLKIRCPEGTALWASAGFIEDGVVTANKLNVRSGPDLKYNVICQLSRDDKVVALELSDDGKWRGIKPTDNAYLWVHKDLVKRKGEPALHDRYLERRAEFTARLKKAESEREENMKKHPRHVPFDEMIAEYEAIAEEYAEFRQEAKLASTRARELTNMKKQVSAGIAAEKKIEEEGKTRSDFEPRYLTARGILTPAEGREIFKIVQKTRVVCVAKSKTILLKQYSGKPVQIWGMDQYDTSWDVPLIDVTRIKRTR